MKADIKKIWVDALNSGEYKQGVGRLRTYMNRFCCLGVLCNLHAQAHPEIAITQTNEQVYLTQTGLLPKAVMEWAGLHENHGGDVIIDGIFDHLTTHNDGLKNLDGSKCIKRATFKQIAEAIEKQL